MAYYGKGRQIEGNSKPHGMNYRVKAREEKSADVLSISHITFGLIVVIVSVGILVRVSVLPSVSRLFEYVRIVDLRMCLCNPDQDIVITRADKIRLAASLYGTREHGRRVGILLLHGNTPLGRKLGIYKVLASKLAQRGYLVMSVDFSGFGESDDPFQLGNPEALDRDIDVDASLDFLKTLENVDEGQIHVVGHSMGGGNAFSVGIRNPVVKTIVAIGPPRRTEERARNPDDMGYFWKRALNSRIKIYNRPFPEWYTRTIWFEQRFHSNNINRHIGYLSQPSHKPLLLIDGENESREDKAFLAEYYARIGEPKRYTTIANSDHYANTRSWMGLNVYDSKLIKATVDEIGRWVVGFRKLNKASFGDVQG